MSTLYARSDTVGVLDNTQVKKVKKKRKKTTTYFKQENKQFHQLEKRPAGKE